VTTGHAIGGERLKRGKAGLVMATAVCVLLVFFIELSESQANSKSGIEDQVRQHAVLASSPSRRRSRALVVMRNWRRYWFELVQLAKDPQA
jgi:hypothetical protein